MQKHATLLAGCFGMLFFALTSCGKDDNPAPPAKTKTELITQSSWKFEKATASGLDVSGMIPACNKDNIASFAANLSGMLDESANVCTPSAQGAFTWEFKSGETMLYVSAALLPIGSNDFKIESLTETNLVVSQNIVVPPSPASQNFVFTFKH